MTPKEKANELVTNFEYLVTGWDCYNDEPLELEYKMEHMKKCAIICVTEILNDNPNIYDSDRLNHRYWKEVKEQISLL